MNEKNEWSKRQYLLKAAEILTDIMPKMVKAIVGEGTELPQSDGILLASLLRARQSVDAITLLTGHKFVEESWALVRPLAELVVNACYLQFADEQQVNKFRLYDAVAIGLFVERFESATDNANLDFSDDMRKRMTAIAAQAMDASGVTLKDLSWTRESLFKRADRIDRELGDTTAFRGFAKSVFQSAHPYVHSTMQSIQYHWSLLRGDDSELEQRQAAEVDKPLLGAVQSVFLLAVFVNERKNLEFEPTIAVARCMIEHF